MYKLPKNLKELKSFAIEEGHACASCLFSKDRGWVNLSPMINWCFNIYKDHSEKAGKPFCDVINEGGGIFEEYFKKGFREFE